MHFYENKYLYNSLIKFRVKERQRMLVDIEDRNISNYIIRLVKRSQIEHGPKMQAFVIELAERFDSIRYIQIKKSPQDWEKPGYLTTCAIFAAIVKKKQLRYMKEQTNFKQFLDQTLLKCDEIISKYTLNKKQLFFDEKLIKQFQNIVAKSLTDIPILNDLSFRHRFYIIALFETICRQNNVKIPKQYFEIEYTSKEIISAIGKYFKENIYYINYDDSKQLPADLEIYHQNIYVLQAKGLFFFLESYQKITVVRERLMGHDEFASIFSLEDQIKTTTNQKMAEEKGQNKSKINENSIRISHNALFPEYTNCTICNRKVSQFDCLFWNYSNYCFECVIKPQVDTSIIPQSIVTKYIKSKQFYKKSFPIQCPECKSETFIQNYDPSRKTSCYICTVCEKKICVEHQKSVYQCFCICLTCKSNTLTVSHLFYKYCQKCKDYFCELCEVKSKNICNQHICKKCYGHELVGHQCKDRCHECFGQTSEMKNCECGNKVCYSCYYARMDKSEEERTCKMVKK